jgi:CHAD domain-containing protein
MTEDDCLIAPPGPGTLQLEDLPLSSPLRGNPVPAAGEQIRRLIERVAFQANRAAKAPSPDAIHDLRVAIRRTEQALATFKRLLPRKATKRVRKQLKTVLGSAGAVRDCDIAVKILLKFRQPEAADLRRHIRARRKAAEGSLQAELKGLSLRTKVSRWLAHLRLHGPQTEIQRETRAVAAAALPRLAQRFFEAGDSAAASHHCGEKLHEFRIQAKKFRYTLELFAPIYGPALTEWIGEIKFAQSILGKMNDYRSVLALATGFKCGKNLRASLKRSERRKAREFRECWTERFSAAVAGKWKRAVGAGGPEPRVPRKPVVSATAPSPNRLTAQA